jgi:SAM-dependent methyltransferase
MSEEPRSVAFDRAAEFYDRTRVITPEASEDMTRSLEGELRGRDRCLEIGVGTGLVSLPLHAVGVRMVGVDLSRPMLNKLIEKAGGHPPFPLVLGDATRLPFQDAVFGGAIARHVLHLIPAWRDALGELVRVVRPRGVLLLNIGVAGGAWGEVQDRLEAAVGPGARRVGLQSTDHGLLDDVLGHLGVRPRELPPVWEVSDSTLETYFREAEERVFSWTWSVPPDRLAAAVEATRAWASERFGRLDDVLEPRYPIIWRAYDVPD